jgi:hypothetical protein
VNDLAGCVEILLPLILVRCLLIAGSILALNWDRQWR